MTPQPMHLLVILFIALLFFGPAKLAGLGEGIRSFKDALKDEPTEVKSPAPDGTKQG